MKYFEIITRDNRRPDHPEDNTVIVPAIGMSEAIEIFHKFGDEGKLHVCSIILSCREIYYFLDPSTLKK